MINQLIFYGPTGKELPPNKLGGGERGCLRTICLYKELGGEVLPIEKPNLGRGKIAFVLFFFITPILFILVLLKHPKIPVHLTGFYENQLFYECLMFMISKIFKRKIVYELRNGTMVKTLDRHSWLYKRTMKSMVEKSDVVLCQGMEFVDFIQKNWKANTIYYPNYVMNSFIHPYNEQRRD